MVGDKIKRGGRGRENARIKKVEQKKRKQSEKRGKNKKNKDDSEAHADVQASVVPRVKKKLNSKKKRKLREREEREQKALEKAARQDYNSFGGMKATDFGKGGIPMTLHVTQIPFTASKEDIWGHFDACGVTDVRMCMNYALEGANKFKGVAFVEVLDGKKGLSLHLSKFSCVDYSSKKRLRSSSRHSTTVDKGHDLDDEAAFLKRHTQVQDDESNSNKNTITRVINVRPQLSAQELAELVDSRKILKAKIMKRKKSKSSGSSNKGNKKKGSNKIQGGQSTSYKKIVPSNGKRKRFQN